MKALSRPGRVMAHALVAAALGLPVALLAHAFAFGSNHAVAGALQSAALAGGALVLLSVVALSARATAQGTIAAARVRAHLPHAVWLSISGAAWFGLLELCESPHAIAAAGVAAALIVASLAIHALVGAFARWLAAIAIAVCTGRFDARARANHVPAFSFFAPRAHRLLAHSTRLFSRPPPAFS
ncbi:MAG: hypothetical protein ABR508_09450 [Candidatus Baltobacteraceae bacterium]